MCIIDKYKIAGKRGKGSAFELDWTDRDRTTRVREDEIITMFISNLASPFISSMSLS